MWQLVSEFLYSIELRLVRITKSIGVKIRNSDSVEQFGPEQQAASAVNIRDNTKGREKRGFLLT